MAHNIFLLIWGVNSCRQPTGTSRYIRIICDVICEMKGPNVDGSNKKIYRIKIYTISVTCNFVFGVVYGYTKYDFFAIDRRDRHNLSVLYVRNIIRNTHMGHNINKSTTL